MKKVLVSVMAVLAFALTSNAQIWIGGNIGASHTGGVIKNDPLNGGDDSKLAKTNKLFGNLTKCLIDVGLDILQFFSTLHYQRRGTLYIGHHVV